MRHFVLFSYSPIENYGNFPAIFKKFGFGESVLFLWKSKVELSIYFFCRSDPKNQKYQKLP